MASENSRRWNPEGPPSPETRLSVRHIKNHPKRIKLKHLSRFPLPQEKPNRPRIIGHHQASLCKLWVIGCPRRRDGPGTNKAPRGWALERCLKKQSKSSKISCSFFRLFDYPAPKSKGYRLGAGKSYSE